MLEMDIGVVKGMTIIKLEGDLTSSTFKKFDEGVDYLLYMMVLQLFTHILNRKKIQNLNIRFTNIMVKILLILAVLI